MSSEQRLPSRLPGRLPGRLLITGATGFIGSRLALHAHRSGIDVLATGRAELDIERDRIKELQAADVAVQIGVLQDVELVRQLVRGRNTVIHLAAAQHESEMPASYFHAVNVAVVHQLLEECRRAGVERFVYGSTIGVYGALANGALDETSPVRPDNVYTDTKLQAEELVRARAQDFATCIVRIAETYGPGDQRLLKLFRAIDRAHFFMIGDGSNRHQCIHVHDLVRGLLLAAQHDDAVGETFVFAGREVLTTGDMVERIALALQRKPPKLQLPMWPFLAAAAIMQATLQPLRIQPPLHSRRLDFFRKSFVFSTAKAAALLGFQPEIDFQSGAAETARWYRAHGYLSSRRSGEFPRTESA